MDDVKARLTPSQTIGPFFRHGLEWAVAARLPPLAEDEWMIQGAVIDALGMGVSDAMLEVWQPALPPRSTRSVAQGFQRVYTDEAGRFAFVVRRSGPGPCVAHVTVFARGLLVELRTRVYVGASTDALRECSELRSLPEERLATLLASTMDSEHRTLEWSVRLQGDRETVFFSYS